MPRLPSASDVAAVPIRRDPGLSVPGTSVPSISVPRKSVPEVRVPQGAFDSTLGIAASELAPGMLDMADGLRKRDERLEKAAQAQENRRGIVNSAKKQGQYRRDSDIQFRTVLESLSSDDKQVSDDETISEFGQYLSSRRMELLNEFDGPEDIRANMEVRLLDIESEFIGKMAAESTKIGHSAILDEADSRLAPLLQQVSKDPSRESIASAMLAFEDGISDLLPGLGPEGDKSVRSGREDIALTALNVLILKGDTAQAENLLDNDLLNELSPKNQQTIRGRIIQVNTTHDRLIERAQIQIMVNEAKLQAKRDHISTVLAEAGAPPIDASGIADNDATLTPFATSEVEGEKEVVSEDSKDVARLFSASRRLLSAGESGLATGLLSQARFIVENSPDMQRNKELDKPISESLASELGVPVGTSLRTVMGVIPRSPEEMAESKSAASKRGGKRIEGEEQIAFIDEASTMITDLLGDLQEDPTLVGAGGSLRSTGQSALGVLGDLGGAKLVEQARSLAFENTDLGLDDVNKLFDDPTLSVLSILENSIGLILARLRAPDGRIPVDVIKRSIDDVTLTGFKGSEQVVDRLNFVLKQLNRRSGAIEQRFNLPPPNKKSEIGTPYYRVVDGKLQLVDEK